MKSDTVVIPIVAGVRFTQLGTLVSFVMKESAFSADNGWEDSTLMARLWRPKWQQSIIPSVTFTVRGTEPELQ